MICDQEGTVFSNGIRMENLEDYKITTREGGRGVGGEGGGVTCCNDEKGNWHHSDMRMQVVSCWACSAMLSIMTEYYSLLSHMQTQGNITTKTFVQHDCTVGFTSQQTIVSWSCIVLALAVLTFHSFHVRSG